MSTAILTLYNTICSDLMEPNPPGLTKGIVTESQVLGLIGQIAMDFSRQAGLTQAVFTEEIGAGISAYLVPTQISQVFYVFVDGKVVEGDDVYSNYMQGNWQRRPGYPKMWHADALPIKTVELVPAPNWDGAPIPVPLSATPPFGVYGTFQPGSRNLTMVGNWLGSQETYAIGDTLTSAIPDSFSPYIVFGVLERIFSVDGEAKDQQRAAYCKARYQEGISAARYILLDLMEDEVRQARAQS
jgi:hypothetical protein